MNLFPLVLQRLPFKFRAAASTQCAEYSVYSDWVHCTYGVPVVVLCRAAGQTLLWGGGGGSSGVGAELIFRRSEGYRERVSGRPHNASRKAPAPLSLAPYAPSTRTLCVHQKGQGSPEGTASVVLFRAEGGGPNPWPLVLGQRRSVVRCPRLAVSRRRLPTT